MTALEDIAAERRRQIEAEGWTLEHDDRHAEGELAQAAAAYAAASTFYRVDPYAAVLSVWPWSRAWLKPTTPRRDLVKAGALIIAEIERLDRLTALTESTPAEGGKADRPSAPVRRPVRSEGEADSARTKQ